MHEIVKCVCGRVLMQCRCFALDKTVRVATGPCRCLPDENDPVETARLGAALRKLGPGSY